MKENCSKSREMEGCSDGGDHSNRIRNASEEEEDMFKKIELWVTLYKFTIHNTFLS